MSLHEDFGEIEVKVNVFLNIALKASQPNVEGNENMSKQFGDSANMATLPIKSKSLYISSFAEPILGQWP